MWWFPAMLCLAGLSSAVLFTWSWILKGTLYPGCKRFFLFFLIPDGLRCGLFAKKMQHNDVLFAIAHVFFFFSCTWSKIENENSMLTYFSRMTEWQMEVRHLKYICYRVHNSHMVWSSILKPFSVVCADHSVAWVLNVSWLGNQKNTADMIHVFYTDQGDRLIFCTLSKDELGLC